MLLFTRKIYADAIRNGSKRFEIRCGIRYRNIRPGDELSINGHFRVQVSSVDVHDSLDSICAALPDMAEAIRQCYPTCAGPFFVFHFNPPEEAALDRRP